MIFSLKLNVFFVFIPIIALSMNSLQNKSTKWNDLTNEKLIDATLYFNI